MVLSAERARRALAPSRPPLPPPRFSRGQIPTKPTRQPWPSVVRAAALLGYLSMPNFYAQRKNYQPALCFSASVSLSLGAQSKHSDGGVRCELHIPCGGGRFAGKDSSHGSKCSQCNTPPFRPRALFSQSTARVRPASRVPQTEWPEEVPADLQQGSVNLVEERVKHVLGPVPGVGVMAKGPQGWVQCEDHLPYYKDNSCGLPLATTPRPRLHDSRGPRRGRPGSRTRSSGALGASMQREGAVPGSSINFF
jgi:hypothetical protein